MLLIIGKGGEGKSRIGRIKKIFGQNMNSGSFQKLETDKFARADQEGKDPLQGDLRKGQLIME